MAHALGLELSDALPIGRHWWELVIGERKLENMEKIGGRSKRASAFANPQLFWDF